MSAQILAKGLHFPMLLATQLTVANCVPIVNFREIFSIIREFQFLIDYIFSIIGFYILFCARLHKL